VRFSFLVTGATGFVGKGLISSLLDEGALITILVRKFSASLPVQVKQICIGDLLRLDLDERAEIMEACLNIDVFIHLAARAHILNDNSDESSAEFFSINRDATLTLARIACDAGVKRFVYLSSIGVNGNCNQKPFLESDNVNPQNPYAISKYEAEEELSDLLTDFEIELVIIRPPLVYGPYVPGNFCNLIEWVCKELPLPFGKIYNKRSLVALDNLVSFIIFCSDHPKAANEVFLISDGEDVSTTELLQKVAKAFGMRSFLIPAPVWLMTLAAKVIGKLDMANRLFGSLQVDSSKARELLGWEPVITMDEQLKKIAEVYLDEKTI